LEEAEEGGLVFVFLFPGGLDDEVIDLSFFL